MAYVLAIFKVLTQVSLDQYSYSFIVIFICTCIITIDLNTIISLSLSFSISDTMKSNYMGPRIGTTQHILVVPILSPYNPLTLHIDAQWHKRSPEINIRHCMVNAIDSYLFIEKRLSTMCSLWQILHINRYLTSAEFSVFNIVYHFGVDVSDQSHTLNSTRSASPPDTYLPSWDDQKYWDFWTEIFRHTTVPRDLDILVVNHIISY